MDLASAAARIEGFAGAALTQRIAEIEAELAGANMSQTWSAARDVDADLLAAAALLKTAAGQINVIIHTAAIVVALPFILEEGEVVESVSLGAGNTGQNFDSETSRRVAEFKFIQWRSGPESIRQNSIFHVQQVSRHPSI